MKEISSSFLPLTVKGVYPLGRDVLLFCYLVDGEGVFVPLLEDSANLAKVELLHKVLFNY